MRLPQRGDGVIPGCVIGEEGAEEEEEEEEQR